MTPRTKALAAMRLSTMAKYDTARSSEALISYVHHLEEQLAKFAPTHMANVWRENERLKGQVVNLEEACARRERRQSDAELRTEEAEADYAHACETIAAMHTAAVGGDAANPTGPKRGLVEDVQDLRRRAERAEANYRSAVHGRMLMREGLRRERGRAEQAEAHKQVCRHGHPYWAPSHEHACPRCEVAKAEAKLATAAGDYETVRQVSAEMADLYRSRGDTASACRWDDVAAAFAKDIAEVAA